MDTRNTPILLIHLLVEVPASLSFLFLAGKQVPNASREAVLVSQSYGGLLLATNVLCFLFLCCPRADSGFYHARAMLEVCLAVYHVFPIRRAYARINGSGVPRPHTSALLGGPLVHLTVHVILFVLLACSGLVNMRDNQGICN